MKHLSILLTLLLLLSLSLMACKQDTPAPETTPPASEALTESQLTPFQVTLPEGMTRANASQTSDTLFLNETVVGGILGAVLHLIFAMLFKFEGFVSGAVRFTAGLLHNGWTISYDSLINETPYALFLLVFLLYSALYITVLTITKRLGAQKRVIDRAELRKGESTADNSAN